MTLSEKRKPKSTRDSIPDTVASLTAEQLLKLQQASGRPGNGNLAGTNFGNVAQPSETGDSGMSPFNSLPADLEGGNAIAFYPSGRDPSGGHRPTIVDAVLEQLRQSRMKRQRKH